MQYSKEEQFRDGLKAGISLCYKELGESDLKERREKFLKRLNLTEENRSNIVDMALDIFFLASCYDDNFAGEILGRMAYRFSNNIE